MQPNSSVLRRETHSTVQSWCTPRAIVHTWDGQWDRLLSQPSRAKQLSALSCHQPMYMKPLGDCPVQKGSHKFLQKKTLETGACLDWPLHLNAELWQVWCLQHLLLWGEHNPGLRKGYVLKQCSNTKTSALRDASCYQENRTHTSSTDQRKESLSGSSPACPSLLQSLFVQVLERAPEATICLREIRIANLCPKALGTFAGKCEGTSWAGGRDCTSTARGTHTWLWEEHTSCRGHTALHRSSSPAALPLPPTHRGCSAFPPQALWAGMGQRLVPSHLLTPHLLQFPLPVGSTDAFAMFLIPGEGLVCLPSVPGLQSAGRVHQSHLHGTAQSCLNSPRPPELPREKWQCMGSHRQCSLRDWGGSHRSRGGVLRTQTPPKF